MIASATYFDLGTRMESLRAAAPNIRRKRKPAFYYRNYVPCMPPPLLVFADFATRDAPGSGSAAGARQPGVPIAGKTQTSEGPAFASKCCHMLPLSFVKL